MGRGRMGGREEGERGRMGRERERRRWKRAVRRFWQQRELRIRFTTRSVVTVRDCWKDRHVIHSVGLSLCQSVCVSLPVSVCWSVKNIVECGPWSLIGFDIQISRNRQKRNLGREERDSWWSVIKTSRNNRTQPTTLTEETINLSWFIDPNEHLKNIQMDLP